MKQTRSGYLTLASDQKIIEKNPQLFDFYLKTITEITSSGQRDQKIQQMAIELTKQFAEEQNIEWRL